MKKILSLLFSIWLFSPSFAQNVLIDSIKNQITAYKFFNDYSGYHNQTIDTALLHFEIYNSAFSDFALNHYLGNAGSPVYPILSPYNINSYDLIFNRSIRYNMFTPEEGIYYQTQVPYTNLTYFSSGPKTRQEQNLAVTHTQNVNKFLNVGFLGRLKYSDGEFAYQKIKGSSFCLFSSYNGQRYRYNLNINLNTLKANENGGLYSDSIYESTKTPAYTPVLLQSASSINKNLTAFFQHRYFITGSYKSDSLKTTTSRWNEVVSLIHRMSYEKSSRTFTDDLTATGFRSMTDQKFYRNIFIDSLLTKDSVAYRRFENNFLLALNAQPLLKIPAELRFGIKNQLDKTSYNTGDVIKIDTITQITKYRISDFYINSALIGTLANRFSKTITWGASAELYFTGYKAGNLYFSGDLTKTIRNNFDMTLKGNFSIEKPSYFVQKFASNHFVWQNSFESKQSTTYVKAIFSHSKLRVSLEGENGSYINYVYFDSLAMPKIADKPLTMYRITLKKYLSWKVLHTMFRLSLQQTTNTEAMPMPVFSGFNTSFLELFIFKRVLQLQLGFDLYFNTSYYSNAYMPATGIFYSQNQTKIGNYPFTDVFLNIRIKRARLSLNYENVTSGLAIPGPYYAPHYPFNPGILKVGISWNFYD